MGEYGVIDLPGDIFSLPVMIGSRIFVGCWDDYVHCVKLVTQSENSERLHSEVHVCYYYIYLKKYMKASRLISIELSNFAWSLQGNSNTNEVRSKSS